MNNDQNQNGMTSMNDALKQARELLAELTPLKSDCGRVCGARCCRSLEGEITGMLLFPGEEAEYCGKPGWELLGTAAGTLAVCPGVCDRNERPLACRLFPLMPVLRENGVKAAVDQRAKTVCPLTRYGLQGLDPAFTDAVRKAGQILAEDPEQKQFLETLTAEQDELKALRRNGPAQTGI